MDKNIIIVNPEKLEQIKLQLRQAGPESLHVLSDFDRTLTYYAVDGLKNSALIVVLQEGNYLPPSYGLEADRLHRKYFPIEHDPDISLADKKAAMVEWWRQVFGLLIASGLTKAIVEKAIKASRITLRQGVDEWLLFLNRAHIPLVIFSASGLGTEAISTFLEKIKLVLPDIHILANAFIWDESGRAIGIKEPIMHSFNKDETLITDFPFFAEIKNRRNVILLGDSLGDVGMVTGFDYDNLLKIGFLNERAADNLEDFKRAYDVIILGDGSFAFINQLFRDIFNQVGR